jgi:hypothetical protein
MKLATNYGHLHHRRGWRLLGRSCAGAKQGHPQWLRLNRRQAASGTMSWSGLPSARVVDGKLARGQQRSADDELPKTEATFLFPRSADLQETATDQHFLSSPPPWWPEKGGRSCKLLRSGDHMPSFIEEALEASFPLASDSFHRSTTSSHTAAHLPPVVAR